MLAPRERDALLEIARASLVARVNARQPPPVGALRIGSRAAFVTLRIERALRGCIGHLETDRPLAETVQLVAMAAATEDPRFPPMRQEELAEVVIEVSVLGPFEPCADPVHLEVGRHGVLVEDGARRGLLLPQVAVEWGWDGRMFLSQACVKAGLKPDAWPGSVQVFTFEAEVFEENAPSPSNP